MPSTRRGRRGRPAGTLSLAQTVPADDAEPFSAVYKDEKTGALIVSRRSTDLHDQVPRRSRQDEMRDGFGSAGMMR